MLKTYQHEKDIRKVFDFDYGLWGAAKWNGQFSSTFLNSVQYLPSMMREALEI